MSTFATPVVHGTALTRVIPSAPAPGLRFIGDPLMWIGVPAGTAIAAFATGAIARAQGASNGIPGNSGAAWTLSVSDDGVGMPTGSTPAKAGLGTSIVQALAKQLGAAVEVVDTDPGTRISVAHAAISLTGHAAALPAAV